MIQYKEGTSSNGLNHLIIDALHSIEHHFVTFGIPLVVTSAKDGQHSIGSLHYHGLAVDIRSRDIPAAHRDAFVYGIKASLKFIDKKYQVIDEGDHIHIEYDRRVK